MSLYSRGLAMLDDDNGLGRLNALHNMGDVLDRIGETDPAQEKFREMLRIAWLFDNQAKGRRGPRSHRPHLPTPWRLRSGHGAFARGQCPVHPGQ